MTFQYASYSNVGKRENNEDAFCVKQTEHSFWALVADGVGGHENGEVASGIAVEVLCQRLAGQIVDEDTLAYAIMDASEAVRKNAGSGHTTVAVLWADDSNAVAAHVGDSRIYHIREGKIRYQSVDHSVVQMAVLVGELKPEAVRNHKDRNKLFRVLGEREPPKVDSCELTIKPADRFLLCSDGFWEPVAETDMLRSASETETPQQWLDAMIRIVEAAKDPRQDNYTAVSIIVK